MGEPLYPMGIFIMEEIWKSIKDYPDYEVSNLGRVKSLKRLVKKWNGMRTVNELILKHDTDFQGYDRVRLRINNSTKRMFVHRLVYETFINKIPLGHQINHINRIPNDNTLSNLEVVTPRENMTYRYLNNIGRLAGIHKLKSTNNYQVRIYFNKKSVYLGTFKTIEKAKEVYNKFLNINQIKNKYL